MKKSNAILVATLFATISSPAARAAIIDERAAAAREAIEDSEIRQREVLANLYTLDQKIKTSLKRLEDLNQRVVTQDRETRALAREVFDLERRSTERGREMNKRLGALHRRQADVSWLKSLFSAESPAQLDRHRRFLKAMVDDDRQQLQAYVAGLRQARERREALAKAVRRLVIAQREARELSSSLEESRGVKAQLVADFRSRRDSKIGELRALRTEGATKDVAFFEQRGSLVGPVRGPVARAFGAVSDPSFKFKLMHKGWFYRAARAIDVTAVAAGKVVVARDLPGWGPTVIIDHGDHYRSVYSSAARIKVKEGASVRAGDALASTGDRSPLFGPGLYFELRHFADAIDPRTWIKDPETTFRKRDQE